MPQPYHVINLLKNHIYPTYQLHAYMANKKTDPRDGLRLAALTSMQWLKMRLGENAPEAWNSIPSPEQYKAAVDSDLPSLYLNQGHVINIVSLPDKGMWTLQISEPDLGPDPGRAVQSRPAVPGRIIETNIGFRIVDKQLECGFQTVISDPVGIAAEAEVYRLAAVRELMKNPAFGLKQIIELTESYERIFTIKQVKNMMEIVRHTDNHLPAVVFSQSLEEDESAKEPPVFMRTIDLPPGFPKLTPITPSSALPVKPKAKMIAVDPPYDLKKFVHYVYTHCRTYVLEQKTEESFAIQSGLKVNNGDIVILYPTSLGGGHKIIHPESNPDAADFINKLEHEVKSYLRGRPIDFGNIKFLSAARQELLRFTDEFQESAAKKAAETDAGYQQQIVELKMMWQGDSSRKDSQISDLQEQLSRQKEYSSRLEQEKALLREKHSAELQKLNSIIEGQGDTIAYLRSKDKLPKDYSEIAAWAKQNLAGRLILHDKAINRLENCSSRCASTELICMALQFLASEYWEQRYWQISKDIVQLRCSEKYGRPFEVTPVGITTIEYTPLEYKIKYFRNAQGKLKESALDYHLRAGNDSENLLRIYFLHDDANKLIVVGSLPDHLRSVKIQ